MKISRNTSGLNNELIQKFAEQAGGDTNRSTLYLSRMSHCDNGLGCKKQARGGHGNVALLRSNPLII